MNIEDQRSLQQRREDSQDIGNNRTANPTMGDVIAARFNRRGVMCRSLAVANITATIRPLALASARTAVAATSNFGFCEIEAGVDLGDGLSSDCTSFETTTNLRGEQLQFASDVGRGAVRERYCLPELPFGLLEPGNHLVSMSVSPNLLKTLGLISPIISQR